MNDECQIRFDDNKDYFGNYYRFRSKKYFVENTIRIIGKLRGINAINLELPAKNIH